MQYVQWSSASMRSSLAQPITRGASLEQILPPLEKCVDHSLKLLGIVEKFWAPLQKLFAPPGVSSWLRA